MISREDDLSAANTPPCREQKGLSAVRPSRPLFTLASVIGTPEREGRCQGLSVHPRALSSREGWQQAFGGVWGGGVHTEKPSAELASVICEDDLDHSWLSTQGLDFYSSHPPCYMYFS